jgi:hypothetical protein
MTAPPPHAVLAAFPPSAACAMPHGRGRAGDGTRRFANIARRKTFPTFLSEPPRQDSQVTMDGRLGVLAGQVAGSHEGRQ